MQENDRISERVGEQPANVVNKTGIPKFYHDIVSLPKYGYLIEVVPERVSFQTQNGSITCVVVLLLIFENHRTLSQSKSQTLCEVTA